jgi:predicted lipoprotein with Yx(FWY)xxD motif
MKNAISAVFLAAVLAACASMGGEPMGARFDGATLVNSAGMTLYTFDKDVAGSGKSTCNGPCAVNWPPLGAAAADNGSGDWSIVVRDDNSRQWAYQGKPVYLWIKDQKPGDKSGDGFNKVWHVVAR